MRAGIDRRAMAALSSGHLAGDFANGSLPGLLPFLVDRFALSYTLAAALMLASAVSSSLIQPLFGVWSDRHGAVWLLPGGVGLAGVGIALAANAPNYWSCLLLVLLAGLGVAAYHPEGSKFAAYVSGRRRATGMAAFAVGGNLGYALGPIVATPIVLALGLRGGLLLALPGLVVAATLTAVLPYLRRFADEGGWEQAEGEDRPRALVLLLAVISFRSTAWFGLVTFVPLWEVSLGHSKSHASHLLALMLLAGGVGTLAAGPAADRFGLRRVLLTSLVATPPLVLGYVQLGGAVGAACLAGVGVAVVSTFGICMVMGQEYLPSRIGMASGLSIGLSMGLGGVGALALGAVADSVDLRTSFYAAAGISLLAVALAVFLPKPSGRVLAPELVAQ